MQQRSPHLSNTCILLILWVLIQSLFCRGWTIQRWKNLPHKTNKRTSTRNSSCHSRRIKLIDTVVIFKIFSVFFRFICILNKIFHREGNQIIESIVVFYLHKEGWCIVFDARTSSKKAFASTQWNHLIVIFPRLYSNNNKLNDFASNRSNGQQFLVLHKLSYISSMYRKVNNTSKQDWCVVFSLTKQHGVWRSW